MRRRIASSSIALLLPAVAAAAAEQEKAEKTLSGLSPTLQMILLWVNFLLLAMALWWLIKKYAAPYFAARSQRITREIAEASRIRKEAETSSAEVDRRLANLEADLAALRAESRKELELLDRQTGSRATAEIARIQNAAEQEIAAALKAARQELKRYAAGLAVQLAGDKIRARMTPDTEDALVREFVQELDGSGARAQAN